MGENLARRGVRFAFSAYLWQNRAILNWRNDHA